ncbi:hypothetical protein DYD21_16015 [Rhodohalobacter sp. SW132]|uniref:hypothetical protein n=1 Tax=Rhodohalobacter sp. SW132 TaxID=2293433 RepID=UPI000E259614|nr:hypothetical protein [Rhodohalobacter sp. SW132]REL25021.1 hypothetical protein DYD21_16015 [Rhodohalobacter sp. SW132]
MDGIPESLQPTQTANADVSLGPEPVEAGASNYFSLLPFHFLQLQTCQESRNTPDTLAGLQILLK